MTIPHGKLVRTGDLVIALRDGDKDPQGYPHSAPRKGELCRVTDVYPMWYGLGCQLEGKDSGPYRGFKLWEKAGVRGRFQSRSFFKTVRPDGDLDKMFGRKSDRLPWTNPVVSPFPSDDALLVFEDADELAGNGRYPWND
jgi:hypothetical protein